MKTKIILGLDMATIDTGYCVRTGNKHIVKSGTISLPREIETFERICIMVKKIEGIIKDYEVDFVRFEDVNDMKTNGDTAKKLCVLQGALRYLLFEIKKSYKVMPSGTWRKSYRLLDGLPKKAELKRRAIEKVKELYGIELDAKEHDRAEAILIAMMD